MHEITEKTLNKLRTFYDTASTDSNWFREQYISCLAHYYRSFIPPDASVLEVGCGAGLLLSMLPNRDVTGVDLSRTQIEAAKQRVPYGQFHVQAGELLQLNRTFDIIILSDTLNFSADIQQLLTRLQSVSTPQTRLILNIYNTLWRPLLQLASFLRFTTRSPKSNWLSGQDVQNLLHLSEWEDIKTLPKILIPFRFLGIDSLVNRFLAPLLPLFCLTVFCIARVKNSPAWVSGYSVSVIIPARNEAGNIPSILSKIPAMGCFTELIFVEGHSTDNTWEVLQALRSQQPIHIMQQTGHGKGNAVREGFAVAKGDILMILDADLTMPAEDLPKYYQALASGHAEFANGVRLVYPMEPHAMQFLNMCANKFFSVAFTWLFDQPIKDTLCGTKVLFRSDYEKIAMNRPYFGEFDPFGDFDLLFGANKLNLKMIDIPIRYQERVYGHTNIRRFYHGMILLKMLFYAAKKLKCI